MNAQNSQYLKMRHLISTQADIKTFKARLNASPIKSNPYYLGLLLMSIVSTPAPKIDFIQVLLKAGADVNFKMSHDLDKSALMVACENSVAENVKFLLKNDSLDVTKRDSNGDDALHYALRNSSENEAIKIIDCLLKQFPELIQNSCKIPLIFSAILRGKINIIKHLIQNYIDPNMQYQPLRFTPLHYTIQQNTSIPNNKAKEIVKLLLLYKADPYLRDDQNQNCIDLSTLYLFEFEDIIEETQNQPKFLNCTERKNARCLTRRTNTDTITAISKQDESPQSQENSKKIESFQNQGLEANHSHQPEQNIKKNEKMSQNEQKQRDEQNKTSNLISQSNNVPQIEQISIEIQTNECQDQEIQYDYNQLLTPQQFDITLNNSLSQEIQNYQMSCWNNYNQAWRDISQIYNFLLGLGLQYQLRLDFIGSFATGLWTPSSDINIVFINELNGYVNFEELLALIYKQLQEQYMPNGMQYLHLNILKNQPSNIKFKLPRQLNYRKISIGIFQRNCPGLKQSKFIHQRLCLYPQIMPVFFTFRKILQTFQLHRPQQNGLKTYTIFLMIFQHIQANPYEYNIGKVFIEFVSYYENFLYQNFDPQNNKDIFGLNISDPINPKFNTGGKNTDINRLWEMLRSVCRGIQLARHQKDNKDLLKTMFQHYRMHSWHR